MATYIRPNTVPDIVKRYGQGAVVDVWISNFGDPSHAGQWRVQGRSLVMDRDNDTESVDAYARRGITTINQWIKEYASYNGYTPYIAKVALAKRGNPYETKRGFQGRDRAEAERMQRDYDFTNVPFQRAHAARKRREAAAQATARAEADKRWGVIEAGFTPVERARYAADDAERARDRRIYEAEKRIEALRAARRGGSRLPNAGGGRRKNGHAYALSRYGDWVEGIGFKQASGGNWSVDASEAARIAGEIRAKGVPQAAIDTEYSEALARGHAAYARAKTGKRHNPGGMTVEWSPVNSAWIVFYGDRPSSLAGSNYFATKAELKQALASLGLKLTGNRITVA